VLYSQVLRTLAFSARKTFAAKTAYFIDFEEWLIRVSSLIVSITGQSWPHWSLRLSTYPLLRNRSPLTSSK